eukprot:5169676-Alexandrium_andersonii.AAC.1
MGPRKECGASTHVLHGRRRSSVRPPQARQDGRCKGGVLETDAAAQQGDEAPPRRRRQAGQAGPEADELAHAMGSIAGCPGGRSARGTKDGALGEGGARATQAGHGPGHGGPGPLR